MWEWLEVTEKQIKDAKELREFRDRMFPRNVFDPVGEDRRWVGDLGEVVFWPWSREIRDDVSWLVHHPAGNPDFIIGGVGVDVKASSRACAPREGWTVLAGKKAVEEPHYDELFFMCYEGDRRRMWLMGGIERERHLRLSTYCPVGTVIHPKYTVGEGGEIYNLEVTELAGSRLWLDGLGDS